MKKEESDILAKLGKNSGFKVPDNYFADFNTKLVESLPEIELTPEVKPTLWVRVRPYIYLAAMFAGIWCTMKVFNSFTNVNSTKNQVQTIAEGFSNDANVDEFMLSGDVSEYDILIYEDSVEMNDNK